MTFFSFLSGLLVFQAHVVLCYPQQSSQYAAPKGASWASDCSDVIIPVAVQRSSDLQSLTSEYDINVLYALAGKSILASNSYNLSARICRPIPNRNVSASSDTIQLLVHGATFSKIMWDFPYQPETYSWTKRMNEAGYTTIAVDLVGEFKRWPSGKQTWLRIPTVANELSPWQVLETVLSQMDCVNLKPRSTLRPSIKSSSNLGTERWRASSGGRSPWLGFPSVASLQTLYLHSTLRT